eukprot:1160828-Pelagomonas_calceolata.AAC.13
MAAPTGKSALIIFIVHALDSWGCNPTIKLGLLGGDMHVFSRDTCMLKTHMPGQQETQPHLYTLAMKQARP